MKSERGEIEVYLCPDDDGLGNLDEGKDDYIGRETHVNEQNEVKGRSNSFSYPGFFESSLPLTRT